MATGAENLCYYEGPGKGQGGGPSHGSFNPTDRIWPTKGGHVWTPYGQPTKGGHMYRPDGGNWHYNNRRAGPYSDMGHNNYKGPNMGYDNNIRQRGGSSTDGGVEFPKNAMGHCSLHNKQRCLDCLEYNPSSGLYVCMADHQCKSSTPQTTNPAITNAASGAAPPAQSTPALQNAPSNGVVPPPSVNPSAGTHTGTGAPPSVNQNANNNQNNSHMNVNLGNHISNVNLHQHPHPNSQGSMCMLQHKRPRAPRPPGPMNGVPPPNPANAMATNSQAAFCMEHNKRRNLSVLLDDGSGFLRCASEHRCRGFGNFEEPPIPPKGVHMNAITNGPEPYRGNAITNDAKQTGQAICTMHQKMRPQHCLQPDGMVGFRPVGPLVDDGSGAWHCKPDMECKRKETGHHLTDYPFNGAPDPSWMESGPHNAIQPYHPRPHFNNHNNYYHNQNGPHHGPHNNHHHHHNGHHNNFHGPHHHNPHLHHNGYHNPHHHHNGYHAHHHNGYYAHHHGGKGGNPEFRTNTNLQLCLVHNKLRKLACLEEDKNGNLVCTAEAKCRVRYENSPENENRTPNVMQHVGKGAAVNNALPPPPSGHADPATNAIEFPSVKDQENRDRSNSSDQLAPPGCGLCSIHGTFREWEFLLHDGMGGFMCAEETMCQVNDPFYRSPSPPQAPPGNSSSTEHHHQPSNINTMAGGSSPSNSPPPAASNTLDGNSGASSGDDFALSRIG